MRIRKSDIEEIETLMDIYAYARDFMVKTGNPKQWAPNKWPPEEVIRNDIKVGKSYVCVDDDDNILGTFYFDYGDDIDPTYRRIEQGSWKNSDPYGVVHRIASSGQEKGVGTFCINWAYDQCGHLRIDTHGDNKVMQNLLSKLNFTKCGIIYVEQDNDPRFAYEKFE